MTDPLLPPPGILADLCEFAARISPRHQPMFNLAAALASLSSLQANKFKVFPTENALNLYLILEAESGGGKSGPRDAVVALHKEFRQEARLLATPASAPALLRNLASDDEFASPNRMATIDEFGKFLRHAQKPGSHYAELVTEFVRLWEMGTKYMPARAYADEKRTIPGINNPFVVLLGMSTLPPLVRALSSVEVLDGTLNRFLFIPSQLKRGEGWNDQRDRLLLPSLKEKLQRLINTPGPQTIEVDDCLPLLHKFRDEADKKIPATEWGPVWTRAYENALRITGLVTLSEALSEGSDLTNLRARDNHAEYAIAFVRRSCEAMAQMCKEELADSEHDRDCKEVLKYLRRLQDKEHFGRYANAKFQGRAREMNEKGWVYTSQTLRATKMGKKRHDAALLELAERGEVTEGATEDGAPLYKAAD